MSSSPMSAFKGMKKPAYIGETISFSKLASLFGRSFSPEDAEADLNDPMCAYISEFSSKAGENYVVTFEALEGGITRSAETFMLHIRKPDNVVRAHLSRSNNDMLKVIDFSVEQGDALFSNAETLNEVYQIYQQNCEITPCNNH